MIAAEALKAALRRAAANHARLARTEPEAQPAIASQPTVDLSVAPVPAPPVATVTPAPAAEPPITVPSAAPAAAALPDAPAAPREPCHEFAIGNTRFLIGHGDAIGLSPLGTVTRIPNVPDWLLGMANLAGEIVPVFDPAAFFGLGRNTSASPMLLHVLRGEVRAALLIDGPTRLTDLSTEGTLGRESIPSSFTAYVTNAVGSAARPAFQFAVFDWLNDAASQLR